MGGVFAAHLSTVHDVVACVRRPFDRWHIKSEDIPFEGPATAVVEPDDLPWSAPADAVFVGLKAHQTEAAAGWFKPLCGPETVVVVMQNGIEGRSRLAPLVNDAAVVPAVVYCGAELTAPGVVEHSGRQRLIVPDDEPARAAAALAAGTPLEIDPSSAHDVSAWVKLGLNTVANGLTALTGKPMSVIGDPGVAAIAETLLTECWTVGRLEGVALDLESIPRTIDAMVSPVRTSMQQDREAGRPTEHDAIHGAVLRAAARHDHPVPVTRIVHDLLAAS